jgi:integrase
VRKAAAGKIRSLRVAEWPEPDRLAWEAACQPGKRLQRGGAAAHLKPISQSDLARRYGYFLDHLQRYGQPLSDGEPAGMVTPEHVIRYRTELQRRVGSVTVYGSIYKLRRMAELLAPGKSFAWLREIENDLDFVKVARSKYPRLVSATALIDAGLTYPANAERLLDRSEERSPHLRRRAALRRAVGAADRQDLAAAVAARDGLMVAMLAACPIRIKAFAALSLGFSLQQIGDTWWIVLPNDSTKAGRWDERPIPSFLYSALVGYLEHHRLVLARGQANPRSGSLWLSSATGDPMPLSSVEGAIRRITGRSFGIEIGPHAFRTAAATTSANLAPKLPGLATALLQHRHPAITEQHYNRATSHQAAQAYAEILEQLRNED